MDSYKAKYNILYKEFKSGVDWKTEILERSYSGSASDITGTVPPSIIEYRPENDQDYDWIRPSVCTVGIFSETVQQFIEFFTSDGRKYKIKVYKNNVLYWAGWIIPDTYKEQLWEVNYEVTISATDGILSLKDISWGPSTTDIPRRSASYSAYEAPEYINFMKSLEWCFNKLNLFELVLWDASNLYEEHFDQDDSPLAQTYYQSSKYFDKFGKPGMCYDVLLDILKAQNCQLWQDEGAWHIVPMNARKGSYLRRKYTFNYYGIISSIQDTETYDPNVTLDNDNIHLWDQPELSFRPGWKELKANFDYGFDANVLAKKVPYFTSGFKGGISDEGLVINYNHWSLSDHGDSQYLEYIVGKVEATQEQRLKIQFIGNGLLHANIQVYIDTGTTKYYLEGESQDWIASSDIYYYDDIWFYSKNDDAIISDPIAYSGTLKVRIEAASSKRFAQPFVYLPTVNSYKLSDFKIELITDMVFFESLLVDTEINENNFKVEEISFNFGDVADDEYDPENPIPGVAELFLSLRFLNGAWGRKTNPNCGDTTNANLIYRNALYYKSGDDYLFTKLWTVRDKNSYNRLINVISDEIAVNHLDPQYVITGEIYGDINYGSIISIDTKKYMILRGTRNPYSRSWEVELFEISDTDQGYLRLRTGGYIKLRSGGKIKRQ